MPARPSSTPFSPVLLASLPALVACAEVDLDLSARDRADIECDGADRCSIDVVLRGVVLDTANDDPVTKAEVTALDEEGSLLDGPVPVDADARYELHVLVDVDADGAPLDGAGAAVHLGASAPAYHALPSEGRPTSAVDLGDPVEAALDDDRTTIRLDHKGNK